MGVTDPDPFESKIQVEVLRERQRHSEDKIRQLEQELAQAYTDLRRKEKELEQIKEERTDLYTEREALKKDLQHAQDSIIQNSQVSAKKKTTAKWLAFVASLIFLVSFVLSFFVALPARTFLSALLKGGVLPGTINSIILGGWMLYELVFGPHTQGTGEDMFAFILALGSLSGICYIAAIGGVLGSLPGFLLGKRFRSSSKRPEASASMQDYNYPTYRQY
jgi:hypothetical protein